LSPPWGGAIGGTFLKNAIDSSLKFNAQVANLADTLGKTRDEALLLDTAIRLSGNSIDGYTGALTKLETASRDDEDRLKELGVTTRDSNNLIRPLAKIHPCQ
jgi:hypothetical protein